MATNQIVVIGASAGGLEALRTLVAALPSDFPVPICIVVHSAPQAPGLMGEILDRAGLLKAATARDRERLHGGRIYVAPPDMHLVIEPGIARVTKGPRENRFRPAIDPLFRSAAPVYGPGTIGVARTRFRCHTGHAYSIASLLAAIGEGIEDSLWNAIRSLEEGQLLMCRMADHVRTHDDPAEASSLLERADEAKRQSDAIRKLVMAREPMAVDRE